MSQPPTSSASNANNPSSDNNNDDWRASVAQSTRSAEVRAVADMLAKMEQGATASSKLMLAMRFEDDTFNKATSLADYQKRIQKRLKKLTKTYSSKAGSAAPSPVPPTAFSSNNNDTKERLLDLKRKFGERLLYIVQHADTAIAIHQTKEPEKAKQLKGHTDNAKVWATHLGLLPNTTLNTGMDSRAIDEMQTLLERRVDNIRQHVMKFASMDLLVQETLEKLEQDLSEQASQVLASATSHRLTRLNWHDFDNPVQALFDYLSKAQAVIAPPTRDTESQRNVALLQLERMRNAAQAVLAFMAVSNQQQEQQSTTLLPQEVLSKCHVAVMQALEYIAQVMPELVDSKVGKDAEKQVTLEDAWTKRMEFPNNDNSSDDLGMDPQSATSQQQGPPTKRRKLNSSKRRTVLSSRVLLTPGRKTPSNLLQELQRKGARLVRPPPNGEGSHLILEFGNAFTMTIYLVPLLVTIRASTTTSTSSTSDEQTAYGTNNDDDMESANYTHHWTPVQAGLEHAEELHIWNTSGSPAILGHVVQGQLDYASAHATSVLRRFFATTTTANTTSSDFEVEISEGTALLQFVQLARTTYTPNFKDME